MFTIEFHQQLCYDSPCVVGLCCPLLVRIHPLFNNTSAVRHLHMYHLHCLHALLYLYVCFILSLCVSVFFFDFLCFCMIFRSSLSHCSLSLLQVWLIKTCSHSIYSSISFHFHVILLFITFQFLWSTLTIFIMLITEAFYMLLSFYGYS